MTDELPPDKIRLLDELRALPDETEWVEFKENNHSPQLIGEYLSALSNGARLKGRKSAYLVYGIGDGTHEVVGASFDPYGEKGSGAEDLLPWLARGLNPRMALDITAGLYCGKRVVVLEVQATANRPVEFYGRAYVRVGGAKHLLANHHELARRLWGIEHDWSAQTCSRATYDHLDPEALAKARRQFKMKNPLQAGDVDSWSDAKFLTKAKVAVEGELTNAAILLLGREDAEPLLQPAIAWLHWSLKKADGSDENYEDFRTPMILSVDRLFAKVRNLKVRYLPDGTLFPVEMDQYDPWVIREALHNAIAHQDYSLKGRVVVVEKPDELVFSNSGGFIPGSVEKVIHEDVPPRQYRNPFLCQAMVNLGMIDTQGGGIRRMFMEQKRRCFPMPEYDLSRPSEVRVRVPGQLIDARYTRLLIKKKDLDLDTAIMLDRVQRGRKLTREQYDDLKKQKLVEGRWGAYHLAANIAAVVGAKEDYIRARGLDSKHYEALLIEYLRRFGQATRQDIDKLLMDKLPDVLDETQKRHRIHNLLSTLKKEGKVVPMGRTRAAVWKLRS